MVGQQGKCVLLVEDNLANMELATDLLEVAGYQVFQAMTAEDAFKIAAEEHIDLILMDISLPGIDGLEATRRLKRDPRTARIPIIAMTAQAMPGDCGNAIAAGCTAYITKPIDTRRFVQNAAAYIRREGL